MPDAPEQRAAPGALNALETLSRRRFLSIGGALAAGMVSGASIITTGCDVSPYGALGEPDGNGIRLPAGFRSRLIARSGDPVGPRGYAWHRAPDGGATFATRRGGWIYVSNAEILYGGGVGAIVFSPQGRVIDAYSILSGTHRNCAGGATPWQTWLSCEEVAIGQVYECDPWGERPAVVRPALGRFNHEAVAVDPHDRALYLTEDEADGCLYRFLPNAWPELGSGRLEIAEVGSDARLVWHPVPNADPNLSAGETPTRRQVPEATPFRGGEGIVYDEAARSVFFSTKHDGRVWQYRPASGAIRVLYEPAADPLAQLTGVDNLAMTPTGQVLVAEDGGNMELVLVDRDGFASPLLRVEGQDRSELTGPAFDPKGQRLYVSSQRGIDGRGLTYEVRGPFARGNRWHREHEVRRGRHGARHGKAG